MLHRSRLATLAAAVALAALVPSPARSQAAFVGADEVRAAQAGKPPATVVDTRTLEEYAAGHIPGALGIFAPRLAADGPRLLPRDRKAPLVFYCRGPG